MNNIITCGLFNTIQKNVKIALFSTTELALQLKDFIQKYRPDIEITCFIDSFKASEVIDGLNVYHPNNIPENIDLIVIASLSNSKLLASILEENNYKNYILISDELWAIIKQYNSNTEYFKFVPPGHYYSPIPTEEESKKAVENAKKDIDVDKNISIDYNINQQLENLHFIEKVKDKFIFTEEKIPSNYYYYSGNNRMYRDKCGLTLMGMILKYNPKRIIEVGSGFSTALMYDLNRLYFNNEIKISSIEPYPCRLKALFKEDYKKLDLQEINLQEVPLEYFSSLEENDILFIDSSHVSKANSDVNYIFFKILPILKKGVIIHFHDIFYPFEYPERWHNEKRHWNELYLMRAFLSYNKAFSIEFFGHYMTHYIHQKNIKSSIGNRLGVSLYLKKLVD